MQTRQSYSDQRQLQLEERRQDDAALTKNCTTDSQLLSKSKQDNAPINAKLERSLNWFFCDKYPKDVKNWRLSAKRMANVKYMSKAGKTPGPRAASNSTFNCHGRGNLSWRCRWIFFKC